MSNSPPSLIRLSPSILAMAIVIVVSNILVQHPVEHIFLFQGIRFDLAELLTWGAFTYPVAFLVTDTTNRIYGLESARRVVYIGFTLGFGLSLIAALGMAIEIAQTTGSNLFVALTTDDGAFGMLRIAFASATAFIIGQMLDITIFDKLRTASWWKAPAISSFFGSMSDTAIFFSLAFAGTGLPWINWAIGDFAVKLAMVAVLLYPFRLAVRFYPGNPKTAGSLSTT